MAGEVTKLISIVKEGLHSEWAQFKTSKKVSAKAVCAYAIGGQRDTPIAALSSISEGIITWEACLHHTLDPTVDWERGVPSSDVMVGAQGQVSLHPSRRRVQAEGGTSTPSSTTSSVPTTVGGRTRALPPRALLMVTAEQAANYMLDHVKRVSETAFLAGNNYILFLCLASAALIRSRLNVFKEVLQQPPSKNLTTALGRCGEVVEFMMQNILSYNSDLLHSALLHDAPSHDWAHTKPYMEGARCSLPIQMWAFYMQGVRGDLWRYTSPRIAESILASLFTDTLSLLFTRYSQIEASEVRLPQYRGDVVAILTILASFLPSLLPSPAMFFSVRLHESVALPIHRRADLLLRVAALKCAPVESLARVFHKGFDSAVKRTGYPECGTSVDSTPAWLTFLNPTLFPRGLHSLHRLPNPVAVYLSLLVAASRPQPQFPLLVRGLVMRGCLGAQTLLTGLHNAPGQVGPGQACGGPLCLPHLCSPPLIPHTVYAAITQVVMRCVDSPRALCRLAGPGMKASGVWDSLDRTQVWNLQRPPWHHALVQLVTPSVAAVVAEVMKAVPPMPPAKPAHPSQLSVRLEHHLAAWTLQLLTGMAEVADTVPLPVIHTAHTINALLPSSVKPTGGHVVTQLVVSALYSAINSRASLDQLSEAPITDGQWDMMIAVGERLCSLHDGNNYDAPLKQLTLALLAQLEEMTEEGKEEDEEESMDEYEEEEVVEAVCTALASRVLSAVQGQHALVVVWEFLRRNMEWVQEALGVPAILPLTSQLPPSPLTFTPEPLIYNPIHYYKRAIYTRLDQESLMTFTGEWEAVLWSDLGMPHDTIVDLVRTRPEFQPNAYLTQAQAAAVTKLQPFLTIHDQHQQQEE